MCVVERWPWASSRTRETRRRTRRWRSAPRSGRSPLPYSCETDHFSVSRIRNPVPWSRDEHPGSYCRELRKQFFGLKILKFLDARSGMFLTLDPGSGMRKKSRSGSGMNNFIEHPGSYFREKQFFGLKILKFFDVRIWIRDPECF